MFAVLFEVHPHPGRFDTYLGIAKMLKQELDRIDGFIDNIRYRSLTRQGWLLSLSDWRDEKALVRWRTQSKHHGAQEQGRAEVFRDYHLRVGQLTRDTQPPAGHLLEEQRLDTTEAGTGTTVTLINARRAAEMVSSIEAHAVAMSLGLPSDAAGLMAWDVFDAVLTPGETILMLTWRDDAEADAFERRLELPDGARLRRVRVVRDYGMFDRREAPQYYPDRPRA